MYSQRSQGVVLGMIKKGFAIIFVYRLMFDLWGHRFIWKKWWHLWLENNVQHFLWMKAETLIQLCGKWCRNCSVSRMMKRSITCFSTFGLVCCFVGYYGVALVSWFQWWSVILDAQWTIFMSSMNHSSWGQLVLSFQGSKGMWTRKI